MIALGDHNFERHEIQDAYQKVEMFDFALYSPWHTNMDPSTKKAKSIDHIFIKGAHSRALFAEEIVQGYQFKETLKLLNHSLF